MAPSDESHCSNYLLHDERPPVGHVDSREAELNHVAQWAHVNILKLNRAKSVEVIFTSNRRKLQGPSQPQLPDVRTSVWQRCYCSALPSPSNGVHLSVTEHVTAHMRGIYQQMCPVAPSAESLAVTDDALISSNLQTSSRCMHVTAKKLYAAPARWVFTTSDKQWHFLTSVCSI